MAEEIDRTVSKRAARWLKWKGLRVVQLVGFALVAVGAYPLLRPFVSSVTELPAAVDKFLASFYPIVSFAGAPVLTLRSIVFIAVGAIVVWVATSRRFQ